MYFFPYLTLASAPEQLVPGTAAVAFILAQIRARKNTEYYLKMITMKKIPVSADGD
jgi:hypothetical protein